MKLFELIMHTLHLAYSVAPKTDKNGRDFVSFRFSVDNLNDRDKRFYLKSVAIYPRTDGGLLMLVNFGGTKKGKPFSASGALTLKLVKPELYVLLRKGKNQGFVWQDQVDILRRRADLPEAPCRHRNYDVFERQERIDGDIDEIRVCEECFQMHSVRIYAVEPY